MDINSFEERYREMSTDELLNIYVSSDLVKPASEALQAELERRGVTAKDISRAKSDDEHLLQFQNGPAKRSTKIIVNILGVLVVLVVIIVIRMIKQQVLK